VTSFPVRHDGVEGILELWRDGRAPRRDSADLWRFLVKRRFAKYVCHERNRMTYPCRRLFRRQRFAMTLPFCMTVAGLSSTIFASKVSLSFSQMLPPPDLCSARPYASLADATAVGTFTRGWNKVQAEEDRASSTTWHTVWRSRRLSPC
jgi:hypothetical protein